MSDNVGNQLEGSFGYSEVTATWSVRYLKSGFECILSLQSESGKDVLEKAKKAIEYLTETNCVPLHRDSHTKDNRDNGKHSGTTVLVKQDGNGKNPTCPIHNIEMQKWAKNGKTWHSHRWNSGFCHGEKS